MQIFNLNKMSIPTTTRHGIRINNILPVRSNMKSNITENSNTITTINDDGVLTTSGISLINSKDKIIKLKLPNGELGNIKEIVCIDGENPIYIQTNYGGYKLDSDIRSKRLVYTENGWRSLGNTTDCFPIYKKYTLSSKNIIGTSNIGFGGCVSLSGDGKTLAVGACGDNVVLGSIGAVFIYVLDPVSNNWMEQYKLCAENIGYFMASQGYSISLSNDGDTVVVGGPTDSNGIGAVWIWKRTYHSVSDKYTKRVMWKNTMKLTEENSIFYGSSVYLSGNILAVGSIFSNDKEGCIYIYKYFQDKYILTQKITPQLSDVILYSYDLKIENSGLNVFISDSGDRLIFNSKNIMWIYNLVEGNYVYNTNFTNNNFGNNFSANSLGNVFSIGCPLDDNGKGNVIVYHEISNNNWVSHKLTCSDLIGKSAVGSSLALNSKGDVLAVGGPEDNNKMGAVWIFTYSNNKWTEYEKFKGENDFTGSSLSLDNRGLLLVSGNMMDNKGIGSVSIYN
jgi:hypothetical protein